METLIERIRAAFLEVEYPGDDHLTGSTYGEEPEALTHEFRGRDNWQTLTPDFLNQAPDGWGTALSFFSAPALQFYLPAYLIADIQGTLTCGDPTTRLCAFVTPQLETKKLAKMHGGGTLGDAARADFEYFTREQVSVITAYLWWKLEAEGIDLMIEQALENYWLDREAQLQG